MDQHSETPSAAELAGVLGAFVAGLTTLTIQLFPFALPLLILVIAPLAVLALAGLLLALPIVLALWLGRRVVLALRSPSLRAEGTSGARGPRPIGHPPSAGRA
jgi:hypothetical protein